MSIVKQRNTELFRSNKLLTAERNTYADLYYNLSQKIQNMIANDEIDESKNPFLKLKGTTL